METNKQVTYLCKRSYIEQGQALFLKDKMYVGKGNHVTGESSVVYMDDNYIKKYFDTVRTPVEQKKDNVNHPSHYTSHPSGVECIDIVRHYCFAVGNAIKYLWRAGLKGDAYMTSKEKEIEDLNKAIWYIKDRIETLKKES
jgi:hypothetical protein